MNDDHVDVSVLIPTLNEAEHIERTIELLREQRFDGELEFLFIDGGSTDRTKEILLAAHAADPRVRVLDNPNRRTPDALNIGLGEARGEYVARMDAHSLPPPEYLSLGVERLRRGDVEWVSGPQLADGSGKWSARVALALSTRLGIGGAAFRTPGEERRTDTGFLGVWRCRTLREHHGWDVGWPINQDSELGARFRAAGQAIVCVPEMAVTYVPRDSLRALARQYWRYGQYRAKTCRAHPQSMRRSHVLPPAIVLATAIALSPRSPRRPARAGLVAYAAALAATTAASLRRADPRVALALPLVLATMHFAWGAGFIVGCLRFGPPFAALASLAGLRRR